MIIDTLAQVTEAVLDAMGQAPDPRLREVMAAFGRPMHAFVRQTKLTAREWAPGVAVRSTGGVTP